MAHLLHYDEWQGGSGKWYCNDNKEMGNSQAGLWWVPARFLGLPLEKFVEMLIKDFEVDYITLEKNVLVYSWKSQTKMRRYKNWINTQARKGNWVC